MEAKCRFCDIRAGEYSLGDIDQPFLETENYFSIISIGSFIEGWTLVIPKKHTYSLRSLYQDSEFLSHVNMAVTRLREIYGTDIIIFEHGANNCDSLTSCGTNHAHLHVVPFNSSLLADIKEDREWIKTSLGHIKECVGDKEYLLYAEFNESVIGADAYIHTLERGESQYFRRILAKRLNVSDFNYKTSPQYEISRKSLESLKGVCE